MAAVSTRDRGDCRANWDYCSILDNRGVAGQVDLSYDGFRVLHLACMHFP